MGKLIELHLKFEKIQGWLFSIPRLRAMVGANVLLGEMLHEKLPALVQQAGAPWKVVGPRDKKFPRRSEQDPFKAYDDPASDAELGITARHGGHFIVQLESGYDELAQAISELLHHELPGLRFSIRRSSQPSSHSSQRGAFTSPELPVLAPCKWSGAGLASARATTGDDEEQASLEAARRQHAARRAVREEAPSHANALTKLVAGKLAETFEQLVDGRYLAVIHADGNGVGNAIPDGGADKVAAFHHRNRVALKQALSLALQKSYEEGEVPQPDAIAPLLPLMLGGDDLLVACRADVALPFVLTLCQALDAFHREHPLPTKNGVSPFELTLGIGVVFAPYTLPFNRLHDAAEALASSAKRHAQKQQRSVVDWSVTTSAWVDKDVLSARAEWIRGPQESQRVLSRRPLPVLGDPEAAAQPSLQRLLHLGESLRRDPRVARSQLRTLADELARGETLAQLAWHEVAEPTRRQLLAAGLPSLWDPAPAAPAPLGSSARPRSGSSPPSQVAQPRLTSLIDLVEVLEIPRLGASR